MVMRILVSGASGLVGSALVPALRAAGHTVNRLARPGSTAAPGDVYWDPPVGRAENGGLEGADAIVNLAGASIAERRWTPARKQILRTSRVDSTRHLVSALSKLSRPPRVFVSASAVGYYGNRGDEVLTESSAPGRGFLAALAQEWEAEAAKAEQFGARAVMLRFGVILATGGGALPRMLLPFKLGVGGRLGSGRQWMSWVTLDDAVAIVQHALANDALRGPLNAVAPNAVTNSEFTKTLGRVLRRPTIFPAPAFALKLALGEMAEALLLASQRVEPQRLKAAKFAFGDAQLEPALQRVLR
jgi:uncharacterized protein (TIGR01777 family)